MEKEVPFFTVFDRLIKAVSCLVEGQEVVEMLVPAQVCVDPVRESELLLRPHRVSRAWRQSMSRGNGSHHGVIYIGALFATNMLHFNGPNRQITFLRGCDTPRCYQAIIINLTSKGPSCRDPADCCCSSNK